MAQKLGLKPGSRVVLVGRPAHWSIIGAPAGVQVTRTLAPNFDLAIWFIRSLDELARGLRKVTGTTPPAASLWVCWPRKAGGRESDVTEQAIRDAVLPLGMVDVKVAALDQDWSGLKCVWRLSRRAEVAGRRQRSLG